MAFRSPSSCMCNSATVRSCSSNAHTREAVSQSCWPALKLVGCRHLHNTLAAHLATRSCALISSQPGSSRANIHSRCGAVAARRTSSRRTMAAGGTAADKNDANLGNSSATAPATIAAAASTASRSITHVLFDMDGLLLDTETFYTVAQQQILEQHGKQFTWELKAKMMGKKALDAAEVLIADTGLQGQLTPEAFLAQREAILDALFPTASFMPGAERLVRHLAAHGVPIAVATSSHARHFAVKTQRHGEVFGLFDHVVTGDRVTRGKPDPEIFTTAAAAFGSQPAGPQHCLVFEDAPTGVQAALAAGMHVVMVPDPNLDRGLCQGATQLLDSLEAFVPEEWGLPPYK